MRARKRGSTETKKSTQFNGNGKTVTVSSSSKLTEPNGGTAVSVKPAPAVEPAAVTTAASCPGQPSSVISAISVSVGVDRKPNRLRREHQSPLRYRQQAHESNGTGVHASRLSAESPNNTQSEPLVQTVSESVNCKRGKSVHRRSFTPVATVCSEPNVEYVGKVNNSVFHPNRQEYVCSFYLFLPLVLK